MTESKSFHQLWCYHYATRSPDGSYVGGTEWTQAPDGIYLGGSSWVMAPDVTYVGVDWNQWYWVAKEWPASDRLPTLIGSHWRRTPPPVRSTNSGFKKWAKGFVVVVVELNAVGRVWSTQLAITHPNNLSSQNPYRAHLYMYRAPRWPMRIPANGSLFTMSLTSLIRSHSGHTEL